MNVAQARNDLNRSILKRFTWSHQGGVLQLSIVPLYADSPRRESQGRLCTCLKHAHLLRDCKWKHLSPPKTLEAKSCAFGCLLERH